MEADLNATSSGQSVKSVFNLSSFHSWAHKAKQSEQQTGGCVGSGCSRNNLEPFLPSSQCDRINCYLLLLINSTVLSVSTQRKTGTLVYCRIDKGVWLEKNKAGYRAESREQTYLTWKMGSRVWTEQARAIWGKAVKTRAKDFKCFVVF